MKITRKGFFITIFGAFAGIFGIKKVSELEGLEKLRFLVQSTFYKYDEPINLTASGKLENYRGIEYRDVWTEECIPIPEEDQLRLIHRKINELYPVFQEEK